MRTHISSFRLWLSLAMAFLVAAATAQNKSNYASVLRNADWGWQTFGGVEYGRASFADLYGSAQTVAIARYSSAEMNTILVDKEGSYQGTNTLAFEAGATAAINGSYFNMSSCTSTTALWMDGKEVTTTAPEEFARVNGIVGFMNGKFAIVPYNSSTPASSLSAWGRKYDSFVAAGPIIRRNGVSQNANIGGEGFYGPHPRTMLGKTSSGMVYMVVMEGRMDGATGFSMENMVSLAEDLGMSDAINLDGGGSSTLWVASAGIVNRLSGGAVRSVPNIIVVIPKDHTHTYTNGFCTCEAAPYEAPQKDSEGYYEIDNGGKLFWLSKMVNNGGGSADARLTADIDLENRLWTPMGSAASKHTGELDGQGHSIRNLRIETDRTTLCSAFIGVHSGTKDVRDFRISGSVVASGTTVDHFAAGVVAQSTGNHKIEDIWCSVDIINPATEQVSLRMAGIVTRAEGSTINRCTYDGTIEGAATNLQVAGILGWPDANGTTVSNCLFAGKLVSTGIGSGSAYQGGIVGFCSSARTGLSIANNLSIGTVSSPKSATRSGAIVGNNTSAISTYTNNYVLENQPVAGSGTAANRVPAVTTVTAAQLTDGSLPGKLGAGNWKQGPDCPVPYDNMRIREEDMTVDGIKYMMNGTGTVAVTYPGTTQPSAANPSAYCGEVNVPEQVTIKGQTFRVTAIGDYAFHCAAITKLSLPEGIEKLGYKAIYQTQLTEVVLPNSVTLMDYEALGYNKVLERITFGENIAANTWGDKLCIYGGKKYEVFMNCDAVPKLRSYTFDFTGANVHVRPTMYAAFTADPSWSSYDIIGDLWKEYTFEDLQRVIEEYDPKVPEGEAVGTDPGCYSASSVKALADNLAEARTLDETATLEQLNKAINGIMTSYQALYSYPLHEGYYYVESVAFPGYVLRADAANASKDGLKAVALAELETPPYFMLVRKNGGWAMQSAENGMWVGTVIGTNTNNRPISLTEDDTCEQTITSAGGGRFKIQGSTTYPYVYNGTRVRTYNYPAGGNLELRQMWRLHPAPAGMFSLAYNLENGRVRGFVHDFEYADGDASKVSTYNVSPPERRDWPLPVNVFWTRDESALSQQLTWSRRSDFADAVTCDVPADAASYEIYNLVPGRKYYCKVTAIGNPDDTGGWTMKNGKWQKELANFSFTTAGQMRHLKAEGTANVRDLGGWPTASGKQIRYGMIFRGGEWNGGHNLEPEAIEALRQAGIKAELDLRSDSEAKSITKSVLGDDISYKRTPLGQTASHMEGLTNSKATYKAALQYVLDCVKEDRPVYFHCAIGRDRTGTLAFLLEGLLGMSKSDIYKDYELTNFSYWGTPCSKSQLDAMFEVVEATAGTTLEMKFRRYLNSYFGLTTASLNAFKEKMLAEEEDPDGLQRIDSREPVTHKEETAVYDLTGRRVGSVSGGQRQPGRQLAKGIYIVNGRKMALP